MDLPLPEIIKSSKRWVPPTNRLDTVKLDLNESNGIFDARFLAKFKTFDGTVLTSYPEYDSFLALLSGYAVQPTENIVLTNGGDQGIALILSLLFNEKSTIVLPSPVFSAYDHILNRMGSNIIHVSYKDKGNYFEFPIREVLKEISRSQGLILCNPNNPLGYSIKEEDLLALLNKTQELNIPCIVDEAYFEYYGKTCADKLATHRNLIIIRTFSKVFGLAGLRLGYILANQYICKEILKMRNPWEVNHFAIFAGNIVLQRKKYFTKKMDDFRQRKKRMAALFAKHGFSVYDTYTNFLVIRRENMGDFIEKLKKEHILINNISQYPFSNDLLKNAARVTVPSKEGLELLEKSCK